MKPEVSGEELGRGTGRNGDGAKSTVYRLNWAGVGAAGGAIAGAAIGAVAGPFGAFLGLMACALAGGLAGKGVAEKNELPLADTYIKADRADYAAYRARYECPTRDRGKKYLEVAPGFMSRLRDAQTFQSNLG